MNTPVIVVQPLANHQGDVVQPLANHQGDVVQPLTNHQGDVQPLANHQGDVVQPLARHPGDVVQQYHPGDVVQPLANHPGDVVQQLASPLGDVQSQEIRPELACLNTLDSVMVHQKSNYCEVLCCCYRRPNVYEIKTLNDETVMTGKAKSKGCCRMVCRANSPFKMQFHDNNGREVIQLRRPLRFNSCCTPLCNQSMEIYTGGVKIGKISQKWNFFLPLGSSYSVKNMRNEEVFRLMAPRCPCRTASTFEARCGSVAVGRIQKRSRGFFTECCTDFDDLVVGFNSAMSVEDKALLIAGAILMDFIYYERGFFICI